MKAVWFWLSQQLPYAIFPFFFSLLTRKFFLREIGPAVMIFDLATFHSSVFSSAVYLSIRIFISPLRKSIPLPPEQPTHLLFPQCVSSFSVCWAAVSLGHYLFPSSFIQSPCSITAMCLHVSFLPQCWPRWMGNAKSQWIRVRDVGRRGAGIYHLCWWLEPKQLRALDEHSEISIVQHR